LDIVWKFTAETKREEEWSDHRDQGNEKYSIPTPWCLTVSKETFCRFSTGIPSPKDSQDRHGEKECDNVGDGQIGELPVAIEKQSIDNKRFELGDQA
jgi:hypothetical protein